MADHIWLKTLKRLKKIKLTFKVKAETVQNCVNSLNRIAETFRKTCGVHAAAVYKADGTLVAFAEDVGRHTAVGKAIGECALKSELDVDWFCPWKTQ